MSTIRFAFALFRTNLRSAAALRGTFLMQAAFMVANNLIFFVFWRVLFARVPAIRGWHLADMEVLYGIVATSYGLVVAVAGGVRHLAEFIEDGQFDTLLAQPRPPLLYAVGMRSRASGFGDMVSGFGFLVVSGHVTIATVPLIAIAVAGSALTFLATGIAFFSAPFWFARSEAFARSTWELMMTFALYPEPLFGGTLRLALFTVLPSAFVGYLPARVVLHPSVEAIALLAIGVAAWFAAAVFVFSRGLHRYTSGSRFVTMS